MTAGRLDRAETKPAGGTLPDSATGKVALGRARMLTTKLADNQASGSEIDGRLRCITNVTI